MYNPEKENRPIRNENLYYQKLLGQGQSLVHFSYATALCLLQEVQLIKLLTNY